MNKEHLTISEKRNYLVKYVSDAKKIALVWLEEMNLDKAINFGLPEIDDRYHIWRVPLRCGNSHKVIGEIVIDAKTSLIVEEKTTKPDILESRLLGRAERGQVQSRRQKNGHCKVSPLRNIIACGDSAAVIQDLPAESVDLVFTSPPYYNARPEYTDFVSYEDYLHQMRRVIKNALRVLNEGRFFVMNISPVLIRRGNRNESSKRIAVPFDIHRIFVEEGYDFIDDIIWVKPEGAGWATNRGRRFAADRNPLQYKAVPISEYILVYRKHTDKLIDWNIRNHPNQKLVKESRISDDYEKTNVWYIKPSFSKDHPAIFPDELVEKVLTYYSFKNDVVMDPFAGIGTVARVATKLKRRFVLIEQNPKYVKKIAADVVQWMGKSAEGIMYINCNPPSTAGELF